MRQLRLLVVAIGGFIAGAVLITRYYAELPRLDELSQVSGEVRFDTETRTSRYSSARYPVLMLGGSSVRYTYLDWFPRADELTDLVRPGDHITIWTDPEKRWVWQIEKNSGLVIRYEEVRDAVASNERFDLILGIGMLIVGALASVAFVRTLRKNPDPTKKKWWYARVY